MRSGEQTNKMIPNPIVGKQGKLTGIVSRADLLGAQPSGVTTLSVYEIASLLDKVKMEEVMSKPVFAVQEDYSMSNVARFMVEKKIGCLPVVRGEILVGIITDTDLFATFVEMSGGGMQNLF